MAPDARELSERELLLQVFDDVAEIKRDLLGHDGITGVMDRLTSLETKVEERSPSKRETVALPAGMTAVLVLAWEYFKHKTGVTG